MTAPGRRGLVIAGVAAFIAAALLTFPAHLAARWLLPDTVQASGLQGTLWRGDAAAVAVGPTSLGATRWRVRPLALLVGQLRADVDLKVAGGALSGQVAATPGGKLRLRGVTGVVPISMLAAFMPVDSIDGRIGLDLASATVTGGWMVDADGTIDIVDLRLISPVQETLGSYELRFAGAAEDSLDGVFRDTRAPLKAAGELILRSDRRWELNGTVTVTPQTSTRLASGVSAYLEPAGQRDQYRLSLSGDL